MSSATIMNQAITGAIVLLGIGYILSNENQRSRYFPEHFFDHSFDDNQAKVIGVVLLALGLYMNTLARFQIYEIPFLRRGPPKEPFRGSIAAPAFREAPIDIERFI